MVVQEGVAVGMAEGYARASGEVGFVSLHIDNGLANGFSLMVDQNRTGSPVVITAGNKDIRHMAAGRSDLADMATPFAKWSAEISHPEQVPSVMRRAFQEARTPPTGPVFVAVSTNAFDDYADIDISPSVPIYADPLPEPGAVEKAADLLADANNPMLVVGDRVHASGGADAAAKLADTLAARVFGAAGGHTNYPTDHELWCGALSFRTKEGREAINNADVVLAVGCAVFDDFFYQSGNFVPDDAKLIHIDTNSGEIGKKEPTDVGIWASPKHALSQLDAAVKARMDDEAREAADTRDERASRTTIVPKLLRSRNSRPPVGFVRRSLPRRWVRHSVTRYRRTPTCSTTRSLHRGWCTPASRNEPI